MFLNFYLEEQYFDRCAKASGFCNKPLLVFRLASKFIHTADTDYTAFV